MYCSLILLRILLASFSSLVEGMEGLCIGNPMVFSLGQFPISLTSNFPSVNVLRLSAQDFDVP